MSSSSRGDKLKGQTIISEALLAVGIIMVSIAFVFVGGNIVSLQAEGLFSSTEERMPQEISRTINQLPNTGEGFSTSYESEIGTYTLSVQNGRTINVDIPGEERSSSSLTDYRIEKIRIENAETICIEKEGRNVNLTAGKCSENELSDFCTGGRCINSICQPERGETCSNSGGDCQCPQNAESNEASEVCGPEYKAESFINADTSGEDVTELGCVKKDYVDVQQTGERCKKNFECSTNLRCTDTHYSSGNGVSGKRCCPQGTAWNGSACKDEDRINLVFVPLNENTPTYDNAVSDQSQFFKDKYPVNPSKVNVKKVTEVCNVPVSTNSCTNSQKTNTLGKVENCAIDAGQTGYTHVIGIFQNDVCGTTAGWSIPSTPSVVAESGSDAVTAHEIGHNYGLNDEYLDVCRYGDDYGNAGQSILIDSEANCLQKSLDGGRGPDPNNPQNIISDSPFCAGGSKSPFNYLSDDEAYSAWCMGNENANGGRDVMSYANAPGPRDFAQPSLDHLISLGDFS